MTKAIRIHANGGPEVMKWEELPTPEPREGEVLLRHEAIGLNYIDVYFRTGLYKTPLPTILGQEAAGTIIGLGPNVSGFKVGDRVAYAGGPVGAYATERVIAVDRLVKLPDEISFQVAAAILLQGMTAEYLLHRTFKVQAGQTILVHAAAGGVGSLLCQWARAMGVSVIGVVSNDHKAELARQYGAEHVIIGHADLAEEVKRITGGAMVPVVYDSVGHDTFYPSLDSLAPLGMMVSYGNSSGAVGAVDVGVLAAKGSLFLTRPTLATYTSKRADLEQSAQTLFTAVAGGILKPQINQTFALADAAKAHQALEARQTTGSTVLLPH